MSLSSPLLRRNCSDTLVSNEIPNVVVMVAAVRGGQLYRRLAYRDVRSSSDPTRPWTRRLLAAPSPGRVLLRMATGLRRSRWRRRLPRSFSSCPDRRATRAPDVSQTLPRLQVRSGTGLDWIGLDWIGLSKVSRPTRHILVHGKRLGTFAPGPFA